MNEDQHYTKTVNENEVPSLYFWLGEDGLEDVTKTVFFQKAGIEAEKDGENA